MQPRHTPLGAFTRGLAAGLAGTALMTAYQTAVQKLQGEGGGSGDDEPQSWQQASPPARVGRRILEGVFRQDVGEDKIPVLTHGIHWSYGTMWGGLYALARETARTNLVAQGLGFGTVVWGMAYAQLVPMGLYEPPWKYSAKQLGTDLSYHLVFGVGVAAAYRVLAER